MKKYNIIIFILILVLTSIISFMIGKSMNPLDSALRKADYLTSKGGIDRKEKALEILQKQREFIELSIKNVEINMKMKIIALSLVDKLIEYEMWNDALKYLELAKDIVPGDFAVNYKLGYVYFALYNIEKSLPKKDDLYRNCYRYTQIALQKNPTHPNANYIMGMLLYSNKLFKDALFYFFKGLEKNPNNQDILFALGRLYYDIGEYENSLKIYKKLETLNKNDANRLINIQRNIDLLNNLIMDSKNER